MNDTVDRLHEEAGATVLAEFFPSVVTDCVRDHVAAKRYLCAVDPTYFDDLSDASVQSLSLQGGPMNEAEVAEFEKLENTRDIVQVRLYDDRARCMAWKYPGLSTIGPWCRESWTPICLRELRQLKFEDVATASPILAAP